MRSPKLRNSDSDLPDRLPEFLRPLFWEVPFHKVSPKRHISYICIRIMEHGDEQSARWMLQTYGKARLRQWMLEREGRGLSPRTLRFWEVVLDLPHRTVTRWIRNREQLQWNRPNPSTKQS